MHAQARAHTRTHAQAGIPPQTTCALQLTESMCLVDKLVQRGLIPLCHSSSPHAMNLKLTSGKPSTESVFLRCISA